jgi:melibiose permease
MLPLPLLILGGVMMFTAPSLAPTARAIWSAVAILLYGLGMSYFNAWNLMMYNITPNENERNNLITTAKFFEIFGDVIPSLTPVFVEILPKISSKFTMQGIYTGFSYFIFAMVAFFAIFGFFNMRERIPLQSREQMNETPVLESIKQIFTNRPLFAIISADFFNGFKAVGGSTESYFWLNNTGSVANATICGIFTGAPNPIMIPVGAKIVKKFGARRTAIGCGLFAGIAYITMYFVGFHPFGQTINEHYILNLAWIFFALTICGLPNKVIMVVKPILCAETFDYMEWKHGARNEALVTTVQGYFDKLSSSITGWLSGMVLTWINYVPLTDSLGNAIPQTDPKILSGIWAVFCLLPGFARLLFGLSYIIYPIHGTLKDEMIVGLDEIRTKRVEAQNN